MQRLADRFFASPLLPRALLVFACMALGVYFSGWIALVQTAVSGGLLIVERA